VGLRDVNGRWGQKEKAKRKRTRLFFMVRFRGALLGPPTSWVPPRVAQPPIPSSIDRELPTSL